MATRAKSSGNGQARRTKANGASRGTTGKTAKSRGAAADDALALLREDHKKVQKLFKSFEKLKSSDSSDDEKEELARQICSELVVHARIEEEIFYPALREAIDDQDLLDEAEVEHASAKELIEQISEMDAGDDLFDAKVTVLGEYINHHIEEEQNEIFPAAKKAKVDMASLGSELRQRKEELMQDLGMAEMDEDDEDVAARPAAAARQRGKSGEPAHRRAESRH